MELTEIIRYASNLSVLVPLAIYIAKLGYAPRRIHIIGALLIISALCDGIGYVSAAAHKSNAIIFNIYYAAMFICLSWFYFEVLIIKSRRIIIWLGIAVYLQSFLLISIFVQPFTGYQSLMWIITGIIMIIYATSYFIYSLSLSPTTNYFSYSPVWINSGVLIYFMLNLFLFVMSNYVFTKMEPEMSALIWSFHNVNNIIKNILFAVGISHCRRKISEF
jgi:hypothetical protein